MNNIKRLTENQLTSTEVDEILREVIKNHLDQSKYETARVNPPKKEPHAIVTYAWDPCGVLLHFAEDYKKE